MDQQEIDARLLHLTAYVGALESLLFAVFGELSATVRERIFRSFSQGERELSDLMPFENFTDEELETFREASERVKALITTLMPRPD